MADQNHLWTGGRWEQDSLDYPPPPPVVIPVRKDYVPSTQPPAKTPLSPRAKVGFSLALVGITLLVALSVVQGARNFQGNLSLPWSFQIDPDTTTEDYSNLETTQEQAPTIRSAPLASNVSLDFSQVQLFPESPQSIYQSNLESIVLISAESKRQASTATGVIMTEDGYIITNAHVVEGASSATVTLWNNQKFNAQLVGYDFAQDLAVLKISANQLRPAVFADSDTLSVGDPCYAIGNPLGTEYRSSFTDGMISALDRVLEVGQSNYMVLVQTNTALNTGNSGGALLNQYGQVVGITTIKLMSEKDTIEGMGFAIPSKRVKQVVDRLIQGQDVLASSIGIEAYSVISPVMGVKVDVVTRSSTAYAQGMRDGDIITQANQQEVLSLEHLHLVKGYLFPGDEIHYVVYRGGEYLEITAALDEKSS